MSNPLKSTSWPKTIPPLTPEQIRIRDDFMNHWLQVLPNQFGLIEEFNHRYPVRTFAPGVKTLEIGAGIGAHLKFENLAHQDYTALELRPELAHAIRARFPKAQALVGDCQQHIDAPDGYYDRVLAIHVLEHLPDLPRALDEIRRVLKPSGTFVAVIPCEGGLAYSFARNISARRIFERRYKMSYDWCIASEHINRPDEILNELTARFKIRHRAFFPLVVPIVAANLVIGLTLQPR